MTGLGANQKKIMSKHQVIIGILLLFVVFQFHSCCINSIAGYNGYGKDKMLRKSNSIEESKQRRVYIKTLHMEILKNDSNVIFDSSNCYLYLEYNYRWGKLSEYKTRIDSSGDYPYHFISPYQSIQFPNYVYYDYVGEDYMMIFWNEFHTFRFCNKRNFSKPIRYNIIDKFGNIYAEVQFKQ